MPLDLHNRRGQGPFDPRGFDLAPHYNGSVASDGTVYNPSGSGATARVTAPLYGGSRPTRADIRRQNGAVHGIAGNALRRAQQNAAISQVNYQAANPGGGGLLGAIRTGITGGGIGSTPYGAIDAARTTLRNPHISFPGVTPAQNAELARQYGQIFGQGLDRADTAMSRQAAEQLGELDRRLQAGRATSGIGYMNLGARLDEISLDDELGRAGIENDRLRLMAAILGGA